MENFIRTVLEPMEYPVLSRALTVHWIRASDVFHPYCLFRARVCPGNDDNKQITPTQFSITVDLLIDYVSLLVNCQAKQP